MGVDEIRSAYEALASGNLDELASLIDRRMVWRGRRRWTRLWRPPPS